MCKPKVLHAPTPFEPKVVHVNDKTKFDLHTPSTPLKKAPKVVVETGDAETSSMPKSRPEKDIMYCIRNSCGARVD